MLSSTLRLCLLAIIGKWNMLLALSPYQSDPRFYNYNPPIYAHTPPKGNAPYIPSNFPNYLPRFTYLNSPVIPRNPPQVFPITQLFNETAQLQSKRDRRFLSLFTIVQFPRYECTTSSGDNGTCLTPPDCFAKGGIPSGICANNFGICCVKMVTCSQSIRDNGTYFVNRGYPNGYNTSGSCQVTIHKMHSDICQYRLEFAHFSIAGPEPINHICNYDQLIVTGTTHIPVICGYNTGQHMYIDAANGANSPIFLTLVTSGPEFFRNWKIRVFQIPCFSAYKADESCLQYHTGVSGTIRSFNYEPMMGLQLSNQDYTICLRTERNFCSVQYTQCLDRADNHSQSFTISGNTMGQNSVESMVGSTGQSACNNDWLMIPCVSSIGTQRNGVSSCVDRLCGGTLNTDITTISSSIYSSVKPFRLLYHTNHVESPNDIGNRGFCLNYLQQPCNSNN